MSITITELENDGRRWITLNGTDYGTGFEFDNSVYGITADNKILDSEGYPLTEGDHETIAVHNAVGN